MSNATKSIVGHGVRAYASQRFRERKQAMLTTPIGNPKPDENRGISAYGRTTFKPRPDCGTTTRDGRMCIVRVASV